MGKWFELTLPNREVRRVYSPNSWMGMINYTNRLSDKFYNGATLREMTLLEGAWCWICWFFDREGYETLRRRYDSGLFLKGEQDDN